MANSAIQKQDVVAVLKRGKGAIARTPAAIVFLVPTIKRNFSR
jgi:hypothetical protein